MCDKYQLCALAPTIVTVMLHDLNIFILNENPNGIPAALTKFNATMFSHYHRIALSEIQELDLPTDPCNNDQNYNFNSCVRRSLAKQVESIEGKTSIHFRWVVRPCGTDGMDQECLTAQQGKNIGHSIFFIGLLKSTDIIPKP